MHDKTEATKFYRTYVIEFETSTGIKYYAGKHVSKFKNPHDDNYYGSGNIIRASVNKYGLDCIKQKTWFDHDENDLDDAEIALISNLKTIYGDKCVNYHSGGTGGNVMKHAPEHAKRNRNKNASMSMQRPEIKAKKSRNQKAAQRTGEWWKHYDVLRDLWHLSGNLACGRFANWLRENTEFDYKWSQLKNMIYEFKELDNR